MNTPNISLISTGEKTVNVNIDSCTLEDASNMAATLLQVIMAKAHEDGGPEVANTVATGIIEAMVQETMRHAGATDDIVDPLSAAADD